MEGKRGKVWSYVQLEAMSADDFVNLFESIPSDEESIAGDVEFEGDEDMEEVLRNDIFQEIVDDIEDEELLQKVSESVGHEVENEATEGTTRSRDISATEINADDYNSEDEIPLSELAERIRLELDPTKLKWHRRNIYKPTANFSNFSGPRNVPDNVVLPFEIFELLFPTDLITLITEQTNLYAFQKYKDKQKYKETNEQEIRIFLAINILMGLKKLPSIRDYWSASDEIRDFFISNLMSRNRFIFLLSNIHLNDNSQQPKRGEHGYDKLFKVRPFLDRLLGTYKNFYSCDENQAIDESMIKFKGRSSLKQYMPMKPTKRGYKVWVRANESGYISDFQIYTGKVDDNAEKNLGTRVVKDLSRDITGDNHKLFFDNYFTSFDLLLDLKEKNIHACGTIRKNRKGVPSDLIPDKEMDRGDSDWKMTDSGLVSMKWKDSKPIYFASNFHNPEVVTTAGRKNKKGEVQEIACPELVRDYNRNMGHVDKADMLKSVYEIDRKSRRWWLRIFWHFLDVTIVNAFIIFKQRAGTTSLKLKDFRIAVARGLIGISKKPKRTRLSEEINLPTKKYKRVIPQEIRYKEANHMPTYTSKIRCALCSTAKEPHRPRWSCATCKVGLCLSDKRNCFIKYHKK